MLNMFRTFYESLKWKLCLYTDRRKTMSILISRCVRFMNKNGIKVGMVGSPKWWYLRYWVGLVLCPLECYRQVLCLPFMVMSGLFSQCTLLQWLGCLRNTNCGFPLVPLVYMWSLYLGCLFLSSLTCHVTSWPSSCFQSYIRPNSGSWVFWI